MLLCVDTTEFENSRLVAKVIGILILSSTRDIIP